MYKLPSRVRHREYDFKINIVPILDTVFVMLFFLLMYANFVVYTEITSDLPMVSTEPPPKDRHEPLALTLRIDVDGIEVSTGVPSTPRKKIGKDAQGMYNFEELRTFLLELKKAYTDERTVVLEPASNISYEDIVKIMDNVRDLKKTDAAIYRKDAGGIDVAVTELFDNVLFGNIQG